MFIILPGKNKKPPLTPWLNLKVNYVTLWEEQHDFLIKYLAQIPYTFELLKTHACQK